MRGFGVSYVAKTFINLVFLLLSFKKNSKNKLIDNLKSIFGLDTLRFSLFYGVWSALFRFTNMTLYNQRKVDDQLNAFISGTIGMFFLIYIYTNIYF